MPRTKGVDQRPRHPLPLMLRVRRDTQDLVFIGKGATPHQIPHHLAAGEFRHLQRLFPKLPMPVAECRSLNLLGRRMIRRPSLANCGLADDGPALSFDN